MLNKIDALIRLVYRRWKADSPKGEPVHPDEEALVCFLEGNISLQEARSIEEHLTHCAICSDNFTTGLKLKKMELPLPLEIALRFKDRILEIIHTTGDILVNQELVPAPVLRSRSIKGFKDEITILKDFKNLRAQIKIENKQGREFNLQIFIQERETQRVLKDLRVTLLKDDVELESYLTESGTVIFEHVLVGKYNISVSNEAENLASIILDIKT